MNPLPTKPNRWHPITLVKLLVGLLFSLSALAQPAFLNDGLVAYYPFNGNANDESGNNFAGTVLGGATVDEILVISQRLRIQTLYLPVKGLLYPSVLEDFDYFLMP